MTTLQIRDLPDPLRQHHRSLSQQALAEEQGRQAFDPSPEELIRQDRSR